MRTLGKPGPAAKLRALPQWYGSLSSARCATQGELAWTDGRPVAVRNSLAYSLQRLGTDYVDIYRRSIPPGSAAGDRYAAPVMATLDSERPETSTAQ